MLQAPVRVGHALPWWRSEGYVEQSILTSGSDTTAPILTNPNGIASGATSANGDVDTDEGNGTLYWVVTQSATSPSVAQIQAGQDDTGSAADASGNQSVSTTGNQEATAIGLSASTTYFFHFQQRDTAGNDSTVVSSASFTTTASGSGDGPATTRTRGIRGWRVP